MQGFNMGRYVPPDQEGLVSGNKLHGKHALGARARKLPSQGALTVRFEMPFAVWCSSCPQPTVIGQGVRFNAEKRRVGSYHSSPVYAFRMRHAACGGAIEIRTDPANTAYVVTSGGRKRDTGDDGASESLVAGGAAAFEIRTAAEREQARESAFATLEKTIEDRERLVLARHRISELEDDSARRWDDPYARNRRLRAAFRVGRKERERDGAAVEDLKDRMSLAIDLLDASEDDTRRAALVDFGARPEDAPVEKALATPLFTSGVAKAQSRERELPKGPKLKSDIAHSKMRETLVSEVVANSRMAKDPFLEGRSREVSRGGGGGGAPLLPGLKRKRNTGGTSSPAPKDEEKEKKPPSSRPLLVSYDSD